MTDDDNSAKYSLKIQEKKVGGTTDTIPNLYKKTFTDTLKK